MQRRQDDATSEMKWDWTSCAIPAVSQISLRLLSCIIYRQAQELGPSSEVPTSSYRCLGSIRIDRSESLFDTDDSHGQTSS